ncbi:Bug family tripartite tricarboxylate transporter substrate binding protein [Aliihoeflea sp. PC F10.4]
MVRLSRLVIAATAGIFAFSGPAAASELDYPEQTVSIVVPYAAGGATDVIARIIAEGLSGWPHPVVVENRPGAATTVGARYVASSEADGHTLLMTTAAHTISSSVYPNLAYDPLEDFQAITLTSTIPLVLMVAPQVEVTDLEGFKELAAAQAEGLIFASPGIGGPQHLTGELFQALTDTTFLHVPYNGDAQMIPALLGGEADTAFVTLSAALPYIKSGQLQAIAVAHSDRIDAIPNVPTFAEAGMPDFEAATWFGLLAPAGVPQEVIQKIVTNVNAVIADPGRTQTLLDMGGIVDNTSPEVFSEFMVNESARWAEAVEFSGTTLE